MAQKKKSKSSPRILFFDVETAPLTVYAWGTFDQNIPLNMIKEEWCILSWSAKWSDEGPTKTMYQDQRNVKNVRDDKKLLEGIWKLLDEADVVVTQNGISFDSKKLNARFIMNGMQPPSSYKHIDTLRLARKHFAFTSNKLEYMTDKLCVKYKKLAHGKFPGFSMWKECLAGNLAAWKEMEKYNKYDVLSLEELYYKLVAWEKNLNFDAYTDDLTHTCTCGHKEFRNKGYAYTSSGKFNRYQCLECGKESRGKENLLIKEKKKSMRR